jgi:hypothetical protein
MAERERTARIEGARGTTTTTTSTLDGNLRASYLGRYDHLRPPAEVRASHIPGAGSGLFMRRDAAAANPGDLVALYAGCYTPPVGLCRVEFS